MRVLVTGGAGYIGSHTVMRLRERGHDVVVLDSMEYGHRASIDPVTLVVGETHDSELVAGVLRDHGIEGVIHFAAYKFPGESMERPERYFRNNVSGTLSLLEAMRECGVNRFVFSSTCAVYGTPKNLPVSETNNELAPESPYGQSKLIVEQMLRWVDASHGLRSVSLRYFNAAGASLDASIGEDPTRTQNLVPLTMRAATGRTPHVEVFGTDYPTKDGTCIRDYIHVLDLADAHIAALEYMLAANRSDVFNLGTGTGASVREVIDMAKRVSGVDIPVVESGRRPGDPVAVWADNTRARTELGWTPQYGLEQILETAWRWHSSHPDGYADR